MKQRSSSTQRPTPQPTNHACRDVGHDWHITTADTFRQCSRQDCKAVERLVYGSWVSVTPSTSNQMEQDGSPASCQQLTFWTGAQHAERPLDLESLTLLTREQRAHFARLERAYYNLISGPRIRKVW
jgi:hypothetical protein